MLALAKYFPSLPNLHRVFISLFLLFTISIPGLASVKTKIDSLEHLLFIANNDSTKVDFMNQIAYEAFKDGDLKLQQRALKYNSEAISLSREISYKKGLAEGLLQMGKFQISNQHDYSNATSNFYSAKTIYESINDSFGLSKCQMQLGLISYLLQYYQDAIKCFDEALKLYKHRDIQTAMSNYLIALSYIELNEYDNAHRFFNNAISIYESLMDPDNKKHGLIQCYTYLGKMNVRMGNIDEAFKCFDKVRSFPGYDSDVQTVGRLLSIEAGAYLKLNDIEKTISIGLQAHDLGEKYDDEITLTEADVHLSKAFELKGDYKKSFYFLQELKELNDSLFSSNSAQRVAETKSKFEYEKQLLIEKQQQEKLSVISQKEIEKQKIIRNSTFVVLSAAIIFLVFVYMQRRRLSIEKQRGENLLLNILPSKVAEELKTSGGMHAE